MPLINENICKNFSKLFKEIKLLRLDAQFSVTQMILSEFTPKMSPNKKTETK